MEKHKKKLLILGIILIIFISPILLTLPAFINFFDLSDTGQIGDTIGGITSPFVNLLGAFLVYLSFSEQLKANKIQRRGLQNEIQNNANERKYNSIIHDINNLRNDINDFRIINDNQNQGIQALDKFKNQIMSISKKEVLEKIIKLPEFNQFYFLMATTDDTLFRILSSGMTSDDKRSLHKKLTYLYTSKIYMYANSILNKMKELKVNNSLVIRLIDIEKKIIILMNEQNI